MKTTAKVIAKVTKGGEPLEGVQVKFTLLVTGNPGHDHNGSDCYARNGSFFEGWYSPWRILKTDSDGTAEVTYYGSEAAAELKITACMNEKPDVKDERNISVKVDGLSVLSSSDDYVVVGWPGSEQTVDPCRAPNTITSKHYLNAHGAANTLKAIKLIAKEYRKWYPGPKLRINDLSLPQGGLFDINNDWASDHDEHRYGLQVDISASCKIGKQSGCGFQGKCEDVDADLLRRLISKITKRMPLYHDGHFHVAVSPNDIIEEVDE